MHTRLWIAGTAVVGAAAAVPIAVLLRRDRRRFTPVRVAGGFVTARAVTVDCPAARVRELFGDAERLGLVFDRSVRLEGFDDRRGRCVLRGGPDGAGDAVVADVFLMGDQGLRWQVADGPRKHDGSLQLRPAPGDRGTELWLQLTYPGRPGPADRAARSVLRRAKSVLEAGQVVSTMDDPAGRGPAAERLTRRLRAALASGGRP